MFEQSFSGYSQSELHEQHRNRKWQKTHQALTDATSIYGHAILYVYLLKSETESRVCDSLLTYSL